MSGTGYTPAWRKPRIEVRVRVSGAEHAEALLNELWRIGCRREHVSPLGSVAGFCVSDGGTVVPVLRGELPGFDEMTSRIVRDDDIRRAERVEDLFSKRQGADEAETTTRRAWCIESLPRMQRRTDGLVPQLYDLLQIARRLGMDEAARFVESFGQDRGAGPSRSGRRMPWSGSANRSGRR